MAAVYKYRQRSLGSTLPLLLVIMVLCEGIPMTSSSSKGYIRRMEYSDSGKYAHEMKLPPEHKIERRRPVDQMTKLILPKREPLYPTVNVVVRAQTRTTVILNCNVSAVGDHENVTFIWARNDNKTDPSNITTLVQMYESPEVNQTTTLWGMDDKRFLSKREETDWRLYIRYSTSTDAGLYQCRICQDFSSHKCSITNVVLRLTDAYARIIGGPRKFIPSDKELPLRLSCVLINSIVPPCYIFWYHGDRMINYDLEDGATVRGGSQGSELIFPKPNKTHVGNYSCVPSNAQQDSVMVYYGDEASVQPGDGSGGEKNHPGDHVFNMLVLMSTFHLTR